MAEVPCWVLDTNVVVSGLLSPDGPPGRLIDALLARQLRICFDDRILLEYRAVLRRPKFRIDPRKLADFLAIMEFQIHLSTAPRLGLRATDPDDTVFLEVAAATEGLTLVTGNAKHFPAAGRGVVRVLSPAEAVALLGGR